MALGIPTQDTNEADRRKAQIDISVSGCAPGAGKPATPALLGVFEGVFACPGLQVILFHVAGTNTPYSESHAGFWVNHVVDIPDGFGFTHFTEGGRFF